MIHTACLFSAAIIHGTAPVIFLPSTVIPIPKGRNVNLTVSDNYRDIAVSSIFCKIFDDYNIGTVPASRGAGTRGQLPPSKHIGGKHVFLTPFPFLITAFYSVCHPTPLQQ
jgi:hypothetical protein